MLPCVVGQKAKGKGLFGLIPRLKAALLHPVRHNKPLFAPGVVLTAAASFHLEMSTCTSFATLFCLLNRTSLDIIEYLSLKIVKPFILESERLVQ